MGILKNQAKNGVAYARVDGDKATKLKAATLVDALAIQDTTGEMVERDTLHPLPALDPGGKILCVTLNYVDHAEEANQPIPETPLLFFKAPECMIGAADRIDPPSMITQLDYEGEMAIIISKGGRDIPKADALDHIAGVTPFIDVSARDIFKVNASDAVHLDWFSG